MKPRMLLPLALCACLSLPAAAQTLYKLIDKNGKVTYSETPPKNFDGKVIRIDIDPNANTASLPKPGAGPSYNDNRDTETQKKKSSGPKASRDDEKIERAKQRVDDAKARLQDLLDNPGDNDVQRVGKVGGGSRPVFTDEYQERIRQAEVQVKAAEEELARLQKGS